MRAEDIKDAESLRVWLESLPQETEEERETARRWAVTIAHRAAMRVLPRLWAWERSDVPESQKMSILAFLQHLLLTTVATAQPYKKLLGGFALPVTPAVPKAGLNTRAPAAAKAILLCFQSERTNKSDSEIIARALDEAAHALGPVLLAFGTADLTNIKKKAGENKSAPLMWSAVSLDAQLLQGSTTNTAALWSAGNPLEDIWANTRPKILAQGDGWRFWVEWYENALYGRPQDDGLLTKIALIDPADWDKGADHVNALIQRIVAEHQPKPIPKPPEISDLERSHINLVLAAPEPARQSAVFLQTQFENMEQAYRRELGCPNETPLELEPIVTLSRTFGQIAKLLRDVDDRERLIVELTAKVRTLEANNVHLGAALSGERGALMRGIMIGALGNVAGAAIIQGVAYVVGPFATDALPSLCEFLKPDPKLPFPTSPPILEV